MKKIIRIETVGNDFYCSHCGEKFVASEFVFLLQYDMSRIELRHIECLEENLK